MDINMTAREDLGLVWMGDMFLPNDSTEVMLDPHPLENQYFQDTPPCLDDMRNRGPPLEVEGFMYLDEFEDPYMDEGNASAKYVTTTSTQTAAGVQPPSRKIKPIKHPALKLQTPIAYQRDTDLSVIPIQRDGMAVCEKCGAIGVKHAFYTRERRFCSMKCARGSTETNMLQSSNEISSQQWAALTQDTNATDPLNVNALDKNNLWRNVNQLQQSAVKLELDMERLASLLPTPQSAPLPLEERPFPPDKKSHPDLENTYEWTPQLSEPGFIAAPVSCFKHAPMADCWDNITVGMKVEVENTDCDNFSEDFPDSFWVATVLRIAGYKALLRYEGFGQNDSKDFWVNLCSSQVHPVGWCATRGKPLIPPKTIEEKYKDWKNFLVKRLTGARTLPSNFYNKVHESMKSRFRCDLNLEVVDKSRISQVKVATIEKIVGKRLHVRYYDADPDDNGFWCHEDSPLIHPVGWAKRVGHNLDAPPSYIDHCAKGLRDKDDATEDLFPIPSPIPPGTAFIKGMKLEAVDPLNLSSICVATIMKVLNDGYMMIRIDSYDQDPSCSDWFCYHMTSPFILPAGFCHMNNIPLTPPKGHEPSTFNWGNYLIRSGSIAAPFSLFNREIPAHGFVLGMRLEAADLMDPRLVCVGTVSRVVGRLLKVHFDGWEEEYDQWLDCESPDMYPVGWCQLVSHKLEPPRTPMKNGIQAAKHGRPGRPSKRGRRRCMKGRGGAAGRVPSQGKSIAVMNAISSHLDSPLASQLSDSSMIVDEDDRKDWYQPPTDAPLLTGESVSQDVNSIEGVNEPEMAAEPVGPDQSLPVSSSPLLQVQAGFSAPPPPVPATITNFEGSNSSNTSSSNSNSNDSIGNTSNNSNNSKTSTSNNNNSNNNNKSSCSNSSSTKMIPRLIDASGPVDTKDLVPSSWSVDDVAQFLRVNDCSAYSDSFVNQKIDGNKLLALTKDDIIDLTGMKVGPSLKIFDLIQQLKIKVNPAQERMKAGLKKITLS